MENTLPIEPVIPKSDIQPSVLPASSSKTKWIIIAGVVIVMLLLSLGGAYLLGKNQKSPTSINQSENNSVGNSRNSNSNSLNGSTTQAKNPTPTPDPTAGWKTYEGTQGFSFKYPSRWKIDSKYINCLDVDCVGINFYDLNSLKTFTGNGGNTTQVPSIYFAVKFVSKTSQSAKSYVDNYTSQIPYNSATDLKKQSSSINGLEMELFTDEGEGSRGNNIIVSNGNKLAVINSSLASLTGNSIENQILSTFKFTQ